MQQPRQIREAMQAALGDPELWALRSAYDGVLSELDQLGALWVERRAAGGDTTEVDRAIDTATRESRKYERKIRKLEKRRAQGRT